MGSSHAEPTNVADAQNGKGTGGTIQHDPNWTPTVDTPKGAQPTPPEVVLGHELAHAADYDKGTLDRSVNPSTGVRESEEKAVGVENKIRDELGVPERNHYQYAYDHRSVSCAGVPIRVCWYYGEGFYGPHISGSNQ